jgi:hypothetical protein
MLFVLSIPATLGQDDHGYCLSNYLFWNGISYDISVVVCLAFLAQHLATIWVSLFFKILLLISLLYLACFLYIKWYFFILIILFNLILSYSFKLLIIFSNSTTQLKFLFHWFLVSIQNMYFRDAVLFNF